MAFRQTLPSNGTNLHILTEPQPGVLPSELPSPLTNNWLQLEPNGYDDFGTKLELVARKPLSEDRQQKKGVIVGAENMASFNNDFTATEAIRQLLSGFTFADIRAKKSIAATAVTSTGYTVASGGTDYLAGDIIFVKGSPVGANNGLKVVDSGSTGTEIKVSGLTADANPVSIQCVGFQFASADAVLDTTALTLPAITASAKNMTQFGIIPGEFIYLGGDGSTLRFDGPENSGWCRVKSVTSGRLTFDKTDYEMSDDAGTGKTVQVFFGDVIKNEVGSLIKRRTFCLQRSLGKPDLSNPTAAQADYVRKAVCNELTLNMGDKEIMSLDFKLVPGDYDVLTTAQGLFPGNYEVLPEMDAFNTSGDIKMERLAVYPAPGAITSAPTPLFALIRETKITINNNAVGISAHRYIGYVDIIEGMFEFSGSITAYFATVDAIAALKKNSDTTYAVAAYKNNAGWAVDMPMISLGGGKLDLSPNEPITMDIDMQASTGAKYDTAMNYTGLFTIFPYLPAFADRRVD